MFKRPRKIWIRISQTFQSETVRSSTRNIRNKIFIRAYKIPPPTVFLYTVSRFTRTNQNSLMNDWCESRASLGKNNCIFKLVVWNSLRAKKYIFISARNNARARKRTNRLLPFRTIKNQNEFHGPTKQKKKKIACTSIEEGKRKSGLVLKFHF